MEDTELVSSVRGGYQVDLINDHKVGRTQMASIALLAPQV
jgi:hypothetical protein